MARVTLQRVNGPEAAERDPWRADYTEGRKRACTRDALGTRPQSSQTHRGREIVPRRRPAQATSDAILTAAAQVLAERG
jgi:hypothetical protein